MKFPTKAKLVVREIMPPFLWKALKKLNKSKEYGFFGDYSSWEEALKDSIGYDSDIILNKVKDALLQVKEGKAVYERDSVLFDKIEYSFPVLATLLRIALENEGKLSVLDFGGSLGSSYYQCRGFLEGVREVHWSIVEQPNFVECGKRYFQDEQLKFYEDIETCLKFETPDIVLMSGVIQCLEDPYKLIDTFINYEFKYMVFDITACFLSNESDRLTVQRVNPVIYQGSYPAWIFNESTFIKRFSPFYDLITDFKSLYSADLERLNAGLKGFIFKKH
jgi:putative methyltransferase (TIGR04325 family)